MVTYKVPQKTALDKLIALIEAEGPEENQYDELSAIWDIIDLEEGGIANAESTRHKIVSLFGPEFLNQTLQGFGYRKPHGYSGDLK